MDVGRTYTIAVTASVTAQVDLVEIVSPADAITIVEGIEVAQSSDTDSEGLGLEGILGHTTSGSGGSSNTPAPDDPGDAAYGGTVEVFNTTLATGGSPVTKIQAGWNVLAPWIWPSRPKGLVINPSQRFVLRTSGAPADALTMRVMVHIREIGG